MSIAKLTMTGMESYLKYKDMSLFDLLSLPEGIDKDNVIDNIILEGADFETVYADPLFMRSAIGVWSGKHYRTFDKWIRALNIEYNPLENYDRQEAWTDKGKENSNSKFIDDTTTESNGTVNTHGKSDQNGNTEDQTSAFDSSSYQPADKYIIDTDENHEDHTGTYNKTENDSTQTNEFHKGDENEHRGRIHGNIGVTSSQQMLQSEFDIARFNIVQQITDLFLSEFCILVYD